MQQRLCDFMTIVTSAVDEHRVVFDSDELRAIEAFLALPQPAQQLYVCLHGRLLRWLRCSELQQQLPLRCGLDEALRELVRAGLAEIEDHGESRTRAPASSGDAEAAMLRETLQRFRVPELRELLRACGVPVPTTTAACKAALITGALAHGRRQRVFGRGADGLRSGTDLLLRRAWQRLGECVRLCAVPYGLFQRCAHLFALCESRADEDRSRARSTLFLVRSERIRYPDYTIWRTVPLFASREAYLAYDAALQAEARLASAAHRCNDVDAALNECDAAARWLVQHGVLTIPLPPALALALAQLQPPDDHDDAWHRLRDALARRPVPAAPASFLTRFTAAHVYVGLVAAGVGLLERVHRYATATAWLCALLAQTDHATDARGRWWDRLTCNLLRHLGRRDDAAAACAAALGDPHVRSGHRASIRRRAARLATGDGDGDGTALRGPPVAVVQLGELPALPLRAAGPTRVIVRAGDGVACSVEQYALLHFARDGWRGVHCESRLATTLFGLLMWDVLFAAVPDVFRTPYQVAPLDLSTDAFFASRADAIGARLRSLAACTDPRGLLLAARDAHDGHLCVGIHWDLLGASEAGVRRAAARPAWPDPDGATPRSADRDALGDVADCLGARLLAGICEALARDYRHFAGGFPDLLLWRPACPPSSPAACRFVEVKSRHDRLSDKQSVWLRLLAELGADVAMCLIRQIAS